MPGNPNAAHHNKNCSAPGNSVNVNWKCNPTAPVPTPTPEPTPAPVPTPTPEPPPAVLASVSGNGSSCVALDADPFLSYQIVFSDYTKSERQLNFALVGNWGSDNSRLGSIQATSGQSDLSVSGGKIDVPAGVKEITLKVPIERAKFTGGEELTLTVTGKEGVAKSDTEDFSSNCKSQAHVGVAAISGEGACEDALGDPYFLYQVSLDRATSVNERMRVVLEKNWSSSEGRLADLQVTSSAGGGLTVTPQGEIIVPPGVRAFTVKAPVKKALFSGDEKLKLTLTDEKGGAASHEEVFTDDCKKLAHVTVQKIDGNGSCKDANGDPYFVYHVRLDAATRVDERMRYELVRSWGDADGRIDGIQVTSASQIALVNWNSSEIAVPRGVSEFTVKVPIKESQFTGAEKLTLKITDERGNLVSQTESFGEECQGLAHVDVVGIDGKGSCEDKQGDPYFLYEVKLSGATRVNEQLRLDWQRSWSKSEGRLGDV